VLDYDEMNYNLIFGIFIVYVEVQILVICNNHEFDVGINYSVKFLRLKTLRMNICM